MKHIQRILCWMGWHYIEAAKESDLCATLDGRQVYYQLVK